MPRMAAGSGSQADRTARSAARTSGCPIALALTFRCSPATILPSTSCRATSDCQHDTENNLVSRQFKLVILTHWGVNSSLAFQSCYT